MLAATSFSLKVNKDIVASPTVLLLQLRSRSCPVAPLHLGCRADARKLQSAVLPHSIRYNYFIGHEYFCIWTSAQSKLLLRRAGARVDGLQDDTKEDIVCERFSGSIKTLVISVAVISVAAISVAVIAATITRTAAQAPAPSATAPVSASSPQTAPLQTAP
jgi:hypothetical protein